MPVPIGTQELQKLFPEINQIQDPTLRKGVTDIWLDVASTCPWNRFEDIPKNYEAERHRTLVGHVRGVTCMAIAMAEIAESQHGTSCDRDMLVAACLLHDASKPLECEPDRDGAPSGGSVLPARESEIGKKIQHGVYTAHKILKKGLPLELAHLVITHTHFSNVRPNSFEASLLFYADYADSDAGIAPTGGKTFAHYIRFAE